MKKQIIMLLFVLFAAINIKAQEPLTFRGGDEFPAEILLSRFDTWQPGDIIYSAYWYENQIYASWKEVPKPSSTGQFFIRCMRDDADVPVKTGVLVDESPIYILYRNGIYRKLQVIRTAGAYYGEARLYELDEVVQLNDNLYYSLCPEWPAQKVSTAYKKPKTSYEYFYKWMVFNQVLPKYYQEVSFELVTGAGKLMSAKSVNQWRYQFTNNDFDRGYIELKVIVKPLKNCTEDQNEIVRIYLP